MKKRFLSLILAMLMILSGITPALSVSASEIDPSEVIVEEIPVEEEIPAEELPADGEEVLPEDAVEEPVEELPEEIPEEEVVEELPEEEPVEEELLPEEEMELMEDPVTSAYPIYIDDGKGEGPEACNTTTTDTEGGWSFDAATVTLTLNGFNGKSIYAQGNFTLVLNGTNTITMPADLGYAVKSDKNIYVEKTTNSDTDILNINVPTSPSVSTNIIFNKYGMTMNGGTINITTAELNTNSTLYATFGDVYLKNDASLTYDVTNTNQYAKTVGIFSTLFMQSSADCSFSIFSNFPDSFNISRFDMEGSGDVTLSANKTTVGNPVGQQVANIYSSFNLMDGAAGTFTINGCLEKVGYYPDSFIHYKAIKDETDVDFIWEAKICPPGYTNYTKYQVAGADGNPLQDFKLEYAETQPFAVPDSDLYNHPGGQVGDTFDYNQVAAYPKRAICGGYGNYGIKLADDSPALPAGLTLDNGGYLTGSPTEPHAAGYYKIKVTSSKGVNYAEQFIEINYGEIKDRDYFVTVGGQQVNTNADNSGTGWSYDTETATLTLSGYNGAPIYAEKDLNLVLEGTNTITVPASTGYGLKCDGTLTIDKKTNSATDTLTINMTENPTTQTIFILNVKAMTINGGTVNITTGALDTTSPIYGVFEEVTLNNDASLIYSITNTSQSGHVRGTYSTVYMNTSVNSNCSFAINSNSITSFNVYDIDFTGSGKLTLSANKTDQGFQLPNISQNGNFDLKDGATGDIIVASGCLEKFSDYSYAWQNYAAYKGEEKIDHIWNGRATPAGAASGDTRYQIIGADGNYLEEFTLKYVGTQPFSVTDSPAYDYPEGKVGDTYSYSQISAYPRHGVRGGNGNYGFALADDSDPLPAGLSLNTFSGYLTGSPTEAHEAGTYKLKATSGGETAYITVNYGAITWNTYVTSLTLDKEEVILAPDSSFDLTSTVLPEDADSCDVNWSVAPLNWLSMEGKANPAGNQRKVTLTHTGYFGKVTVTATSKVGGLVDRCYVYLKERTPEASIDRNLGYLVGLKEGRDYKINGVTYTAAAVPESYKIGVPLLPAWDGQSLEIILLNAEEEKCNSDPQVIVATSVSLDQTELIFNPNETKVLTATVLPADIANADVSWQYTGGAFGREELSGPADNQRQIKLTAYNAPGVHTITVKTIADNASATCTAYIKELTPTAVYRGDEGYISFGSNGGTYLINGEVYETVSRLVVGQSVPVEPEWIGTNVTIVRTNAEPKCNSNPQTLAISSISLDKTEVVLNQGESFQLTSTVLPADIANADVEWICLTGGVSGRQDLPNPDVNMRAAEFTAYTIPGKHILTAKTVADSSSVDCTVYVKEAVPTATYDASSGYIEGLVSGRTYLVNGQSFVATNAGIEVKPAWKGTKVSIVAANAQSECNSDPQYLDVASVSLDKNEVIINQGESVQLTATVLPDNIANSDIIWNFYGVYFAKQDLPNPAANKRAAEFTAQDVVGKFTVTAQAASGGATADCTVYVREAVPTAIYDDITGVVSGLISGQTYLVNGEEMVAQAVEGGYGFAAKPEWNGTIVQIVRANAEPKCNSNPQELAISELDLDLSKGIEIILSQEYVLLQKNDVLALTAQVDPEILTNYVEWSSSDSAVASVDAFGKVTANAAGTAFIKAIVEVDGVTAEATCRVDVIDGTAEDALAENGKIHLATNSVTSYLYSTNYAGVEVYLDLEQNMSLQAVGELPEDKGEMITNPTFEDAKLDDYFALRMADDRTMLIIPKVDTANDAAVKALKSSYKSKITFTVDGTELTSVETLTIKVDKKMPSVKATSVKLESFYRGIEAPLVFTSKSGEVVAIDVTAPLSWLNVNEEEMTVSVKEAYLGQKLSGKLGLKATVEGFEPVDVTVSVSATAKAPKLKLSPTSVTMYNDTSKSAGAVVTLLSGDSKVLFDDMNVTGVKIIVPAASSKDYKTYGAGANYAVSGYNAETGAFTLSVKGGKQAVAGKVQIAAIIGGDEAQLVKLPLTVKVHAKAPTLKLSKTSATLNMYFGAGNDPFVVTVTPTPADYDLTDALTIKVMDKSGKNEVPTELDVTQAGNKITLYSNENTDPGASYKVTVVLKNVEKAKAATITVKTTTVAKGTPTLSLSAKGSIDTARAHVGSIVLTPKYKNFNGFGEADTTFKITATNSKTKVGYDHTDRFEVTENANGTYTLRVEEGKYLDASLKYSVVMTSQIGEADPVVSKAANLSIKQGSIKVAQDTKTINLYKNDRYSEGVVTLSIADATVVPIREIRLKADKNNFFELEDLKDGRVVIGYRGDQIAPKVKNGSAKLEVFLEGNNNTAKPNATVSVSVKVIAFKNK